MKTLKNFLAIDYGSKFIGLALYKEGQTPFPIGNGTLKNMGIEKLSLQLREVCDEEQISKIIFGLPYFTDGTESSRTLHFRKIGNDLKEKIGIDLEFQDETLSSKEAEQRLNKNQLNEKQASKYIHEQSAVIILEDYLKTKFSL